jgi:hypothetical protein
VRKLLWLLLLVPTMAHGQCPIAAGQSVICASFMGITPVNPPAPQSGIAYSQTFTAAGATGAVTWSITSGAATQSGLTLNVGTTASITGTPTTGTVAWTLKWVDTLGHTTSLPISLTIVTLSTITVTPGAVMVNQANTQQFTANGSFSDSSQALLTTIATWTLPSGTGCTGSTIGSSTGLFTSGSTAGTCTVQAAFGGKTGTATVTVVVPANPINFQLTDPLPPGQINQPYSSNASGTNGSLGPGQGVRMSATGGTPPYTCSITAGALPTGLTAANVGGDTNCLYTGTPTTAGAGVSFTVQIADSASHTNTKVFASGILVASLSSIAVNFGQSSIAANTSTAVMLVGTYSNSTTAAVPIAAGAQRQCVSSALNNTISVSSLQVSKACATQTGWLAVAETFSWNSGLCSATTMAVTSANETFIAATTAIGQAGTPPPYVNCVQMFYAVNVTGAAADQPTCTFSAATTNTGCVVTYYSGVPTSAILDQHPAPTQDTTGNAGACTPSAITTVQANEIIIGFCAPNSATGFTAPSGYNAVDTTGTQWLVFDKLTFVIYTSITPTASFTPTAAEDTLIASFKANTPPAGSASLNSGTPACAVINGAMVQALAVTTGCTSVITATVGAVNGTGTVTVTVANPDTGIVITPSNPTGVPLGGQITFQATGNVSGQIYSASWGSSPTSVATINTTSGVATCVAAGTATIQGTVSGFASPGTTSLTCSGTSSRTFYIDYGTGSDTNAGTKASPWKTHPFMACSTHPGSGAGSYTHQAGDAAIFKGGVTWPAACFTMGITAGGTPSAQDYYGVDATWFIGSVWTRPIFDLNYTTPFTVIWGASGDTGYHTFDNLEIVHQGYTVPVAYGNSAAMTFIGTPGVGTIIQNCYFHDWATSGMISSGTTTADYDTGVVLNGTTNPSIRFLNNTVSGANGYFFSSTGAKIIGGVGGGCYGCLEVAGNTFHDVTAACFGSTFMICHDNEFYNMDAVGIFNYDGGTAGLHTQVVEDDGGGYSVDYNNYMHDSPNVASAFLLDFCSTVYNNVVHNVGSGHGQAAIYMLDNFSPGCNPATAVARVFNNTVDQGGGGACIYFNFFSAYGLTLGTSYVQNNICINSSMLLNGGGGTITNPNNTNNYQNMTQTEANTYGFTPATKYAPTSSDANIAGQGLNLTNTQCNVTIPNGATSPIALTPLCQDTAGAPWKNAGYRARPASGAWTLGAYAGLNE